MATIIAKLLQPNGGAGLAGGSITRNALYNSAAPVHTHNVYQSDGSCGLSSLTPASDPSHGHGIVSSGHVMTYTIPATATASWVTIHGDVNSMSVVSVVSGMPGFSRWQDNCDGENHPYKHPVIALKRSDWSESKIAHLPPLEDEVPWLKEELANPDGLYWAPAT